MTQQPNQKTVVYNALLKHLTQTEEDDAARARARAMPQETFDDGHDSRAPEKPAAAPAPPAASPSPDHVFNAAEMRVTAQPRSFNDMLRSRPMTERRPFQLVPPRADESASTVHTAAMPTGSALPGAFTARDAGATLDAVRSMRAALDCPQVEVSAARVEHHLMAIKQPNSGYTELLRNLRTRVQQAHERKNVRTIVVASANMSEGKTLTSINLAWLLAQSQGVRCLLIDADLRNPCIANYLGFQSETGLSEILSGEATFEESLMQLQPSGLYFLPGGAARSDVAELLSGPTFKDLLVRTRDMFDYVIIDAPPLGIFTDASLLINRADAAMLVVRAFHTRTKDVVRLLEQLPRDRMLGVVLNQADEELPESYYYYYRRQRAVSDASTGEEES